MQLEFSQDNLDKRNDLNAFLQSLKGFDVESSGELFGKIITRTLTSGGEDWVETLNDIVNHFGDNHAAALMFCFRVGTVYEEALKGSTMIVLEEILKSLNKEEGKKVSFDRLADYLTQNQ